jgi:CDP-paratose 2-epimerase
LSACSLAAAVDGGLIGSAAVEHFAGRFDRVAGSDNDMRRVFFGDEASTRCLTTY